MNRTEWALKVKDCKSENLTRGNWHPYLNADFGSAILPGAYILARWKEPIVAVSHDDPDDCIELAWYLEEAVKRFEDEGVK